MSETTTAAPAPDVTPDTPSEAAPAEVAAKTAAAPPKKADPAPASDKEEPRKFTIKVNGKEKVVDEKTALAYLQRELAADEKFRSASAEAKRIEAIIKGAKNDPDKLIKELMGMDPLELYKKRIGDEIRKMSLTPEQRELEDAKMRLADYERREQERVENERKASEERAKSFYIKKYDSEIPEALKSAGLPVNEDTVRYTAEVMLANLEEGLDLPYEVVMDLVKDKYQRSIKGFLSASDKEKLLELLGDDVLSGLLEAKTKKGTVKRTMAVQDDSPEAEQPKYMNREEFAEYVRKKSRE